MTAKQVIDNHVYCKINAIFVLLKESEATNNDIWKHKYQTFCEHCHEPVPLDTVNYIKIKCNNCNKGTAVNEIESREILEYYFISSALGDALLEQKQPIYRSSGLDYDVWGRTTSGQPMYMDHCIEKIAKEWTQ